MKLTTDFQVPNWRMSGTIPLLSLYAFMVWTGAVLVFTCNVGNCAVDVHTVSASHIMHHNSDIENTNSRCNTLNIPPCLCWQNWMRVVHVSLIVGVVPM
jgi:hypothetical protein